MLIHIRYITIFEPELRLKVNAAGFVPKLTIQHVLTQYNQTMELCAKTKVKSKIT